MSPSLNLDYAPTISNFILGRMEKCAKAMGMPLGDIELLGQCEDTSLAFIKAFESGDVTYFMDRVDWANLDYKRMYRDNVQLEAITVF